MDSHEFHLFTYVPFGFSFFGFLFFGFNWDLTGVLVTRFLGITMFQIVMFTVNKYFPQPILEELKILSRKFNF